MGLLDDLAATRVHVLVIGVPGRPLLRLRALAAVRRRGWLTADAPEGADVLLVCGAPDAELHRALDELWARVPAPRARRTATDPDGLAGLFDSAVRVLGDRELQREQAHRLAADGGSPSALRLGPALPDWPAGLTVDCAVRDGWIEHAAVTLPAAAPAEEDPLGMDDASFALACERAARLLRAAGWAAPARRLDRCVDGVLAGRPARVVEVRRIAERASRSLLLRAAVGAEVVTRLLVILGDAERAALGEPGVDPALDADHLAAALQGRRAAEARLIVAAAGPVRA